jgi:hypothetical protein
MALLNPTLRDAGPMPGSATGWTLTSVCHAQRIAAFAPSPARSAEDFERWGDLVTAFPDGALVLAFFDFALEGYEDFEEGWTPSAFVSQFSDALLDTCPFGGGAVEDMATGWLSAPFAASWADVVAATGLFGGAPREDFESWLPSAPVAWTSASFDAGAKSAEAFEGTWTASKTL